MQPLLRMLHSPTSDTQRNSAKALELLTRHYQCRTALVEAEGEREQGGGKGEGSGGRREGGGEGRGEGREAVYKCMYMTSLVCYTLPTTGCLAFCG